MIKETFIYCLLLTLFIPAAVSGQTISGSREVCTDKAYTYSINLGAYCTEVITISCTGCYETSTTASTISLKWSAGQVNRSVFASVLCVEPDGGSGGPGNPDPPTESFVATTINLAPSTNPQFSCSGTVAAPGGAVIAQDSYVLINSSVSIPLNYQKPFNYLGLINTVQYFVDGVSVGQKQHCDTNLGINYSASTIGSISVTTRILDQCGNWWDGPSKVIQIYPSCYQDIPSNFNVLVSGTGVDPIEPSVFMVEKNQLYTISVTGVSDFDQNYLIDYSDIGADGSFSGNTFSVSKGLGSYRINFVKRAGREICNDIPELKIFLGAKDETLEKINGCPVLLPDDFPEFGFDPIVVTDPFVLSHFAGKVISKYAITVKPGLTLTLGAELILQQGPPVVPPIDQDLVVNFIQTTSYNEYNQILGQNRNYFDDQGRALQSQYKNLTSGVMLATQTLYDAQARPVINTLSAPISASTLTTEQNECGINQQVGEDITFGFNPTFVAGYDYKNFDLYTDPGGNIIDKENSPDPILNNTPGTLGWYYSTNNGNATGALEKINEPLVAATGYPYSRTLVERDGSNEALGATIPGDQMKAGSNHVSTMVKESVDAMDSYVTEYLRIRETELGLNKTMISGNFFITRTLDPNGRKSIAYTDKTGNTIISLYFGDGTLPITTSYQFYDDASRLIVSLSPNGVEKYAKGTGVSFSDIDKTTYEYNFKGFLLAVNETDAGRTEYVYRKDGSIRFSQNAEQRKTGKYSYTHYDRSGRPFESGEYQPGVIAFKSPEMNSILESSAVDGGLVDDDDTKTDRIFTFSDIVSNDPAVTSTGRIQRFVHGNVSYSRKNDEITSYYSYDEQGRVEWMIQDVKNFGVKTIDYRYGPTGAVQEVAYQRGVTGEEFYHFYEYDLDGRLSKVFTTPIELIYNRDGTLTNSGVLELQSTYTYYLHGPLKRMEYANNIQGVDYVYTANGALKSINSDDPASDPGGDGNDLFGMTIDYYSGDYLSAQYSPGGYTYTGANVDQFSGHIKGTRWHGPVEQGQTFAYGYDYDSRYQLTDAQFKGGSIYDAISSPYRESIGSYDFNGNIRNLNRKNGLGINIADFTYNYVSNKNQLASVTTGGSPMRMYQYNDLGQMVQQENENSEALKVSYDVTGKVTHVLDENDLMATSFVYDDRGFRLNKTSYDDAGVAELRTWYIRDASGNVVSTYEEDIATATITPIEIPVYGNGRLGMYKPQFGLTFYELTDHLGNVRAVIGDKLTVEYLATIETERIAAGAEQDFLDIDPVPTASYINHTGASVSVNGSTEAISNPNEVIRINNAQDVPRNPIGGGILLWVHPGDKISTEVYTKYANFDNANTNALPGIASYLASTFGATAITVDGLNIFQGLDQTPAGVFAPLANVDDNLPRAFLSYVVFDKNMNAQHFNQVQVSVNAQIPTTGTPAEIAAHQHERLVFDNIEIEKEGFIYIYVSNQSDQNMDVYFDDLKVTHEYSDVVAGGDYYPFGLAIEDRQITRENYRYGYQGQFSEKDEETGWNHFELREYDPVIGRWTATDPYGQFFSPYLGQGNNPISNFDIDGGLVGYERQEDGSLKRVNNDGGDEYDVIYNSNGTIEQLVLSNINVSAGLSKSAANAARLGIYSTQYSFANHPIVQGTTVGLSLLTGVGIAGSYGQLARLGVYSKELVKNSLFEASSQFIAHGGDLEKVKQEFDVFDVVTGARFSRNPLAALVAGAVDYKNGKLQVVGAAYFGHQENHKSFSKAIIDGGTQAVVGQYSNQFPNTWTEGILEVGGGYFSETLGNLIGN
ncbi:MAG: RHS repeat-associated core domain-containing protein [Cyclobacteriaceae bacterium]